MWHLDLKQNYGTKLPFGSTSLILRICCVPVCEVVIIDSEDEHPGRYLKPNQTLERPLTPPVQVTPGVPAPLGGLAVGWVRQGTGDQGCGIWFSKSVRLGWAVDLGIVPYMLTKAKYGKQGRHGGAERCGDEETGR